MGKSTPREGSTSSCLKKVDIWGGVGLLLLEFIDLQIFLMVKSVINVIRKSHFPMFSWYAHVSSSLAISLSNSSGVVLYELVNSCESEKHQQSVVYFSSAVFQV